MQSTAELLHPSTPFLEGSESFTPQEANPQLSLPSGPTHVIKSRPRTDEDKAWYTQQLKVTITIKNVYHREVYRQMAYYGSCKPARLCFAAHSTIAKEKGISVKSVQRAVKHLEHEGLIRRLSVGSGRETAKYQILGRLKSPCRVDSESMQGGLRVHQIEEGIEERIQKPFSSRFEAQSKGIPAPTATTEEPVHSQDLPSPDPDQEQEQEQDRARAPVAFAHPKQVSMLFKLQRKLGYTADDKQAKVFDALAHVDKKRIIDKLEAEEQRAAAAGQVSNPPPKPLAPRFRVGEVRKPLKKPSQENCRHVWYGPDSDGLSVCGICSAERGASD